MLNLFSFTGSFISCSCNFNHNDCTNNTCTTDLNCQRVVTYVNNVLIEDDQLCVVGEIPITCGTIERINDGETVIVRYCCRTSRCNSNDSELMQFIDEHGKHTSRSYVVCSTSCVCACARVCVVLMHVLMIFSVVYVSMVVIVCSFPLLRVLG